MVRSNKYLNKIQHLNEGTERLRGISDISNTHRDQARPGFTRAAKTAPAPQDGAVAPEAGGRAKRQNRALPDVYSPKVSLSDNMGSRCSIDAQSLKSPRPMSMPPGRCQLSHVVSLRREREAMAEGRRFNLIVQLQMQQMLLLLALLLLAAGWSPWRPWRACSLWSVATVEASVSHPTQLVLYATGQLPHSCV
jgi:hypothetical protein